MECDPDALDVAICLPTHVAGAPPEWVLVTVEDPHHDTIADFLSDIQRVLREVGLGTRMRWDAVPGVIEAGEVWQGQPPAQPVPIPGEAFEVMILPGSVVVIGERVTEDGTAVSAARLTLSQPPRMVEMWHTLTPDRRTVEVGGTDRALARIVVEVDADASGTSSALEAVPVEIIHVGRSIGVAYHMGDGAPFVLWTSVSAARAACAKDHRDHMPAVMFAGAKALGIDRACIPTLAQPLLDYSGILDPGESIQRSIHFVR